MHAQRTTLYPWHASAGARFTSFAGWEMPVQYPSGAIREHQLTRNSAGLFDISHMGQVYVQGPGAAAWLTSLVSADIRRLEPGTSTYALLCREDGGVIDDLFVYHVSPDLFLVVVNASRREIDVEWLSRYLPADGVSLEDRSVETAMIAVQGPRAARLVALTLTGCDVSQEGCADSSSVAPVPAESRQLYRRLMALPRFGLTVATVSFDDLGHRGDADSPIRVEAGRTGYTGEDGFELFLPAADALPCWNALMSTAAETGIHAGPVGLAARDSLRLESGFALYGHELSEAITPVEARLLWACDLDHDFIGRDAIMKRKKDGPARTLRRLATESGAIAREGYDVLDETGATVGTVVSGGPAITYGGCIANAYVDATVKADAPLSVRIRTRVAPARQNKGPVYKPTYRTTPPADDLFDRHGEFARRHIGPDASERAEMLAALNVASMEQLIAETVPDDILREKPMALPTALTEDQLLGRMQNIASNNRMKRSLIGMGYSDTITPPVIQRNILENPGWYTQYTPYQAEISQGRLEALVNFQTMITDLTGMDIANSSMLDEATSAGEAIMMALRAGRSSSRRRIWISDQVHPQTIAHLSSRAEPFEIELVIGPERDWKPETGDLAGLLQYPATDGVAHDYRELVERLHAAGAAVIVATDLLALTVLTSPGEWGADIVVGNSQRFGVPMAYGGPHAAFLATRESFKRLLPGRIVGVSQDRDGRPAMRLALQTREQHIRRDKATSNICTAQVLLAIMASMYAVYHGPEGLRRIATRITVLANALRDLLRDHGLPVVEGTIFDTVTLETDRVTQQKWSAAATATGFNLRIWDDGRLGIALDERSDVAELVRLAAALGVETDTADLRRRTRSTGFRPAGALERRSNYLAQAVFNSHHSETALLRYITLLQSKDLSLAHSMISLGSCTMKLNPTAAMVPITWPEFASLHPYAPTWQAAGFRMMADEISAWLSDITGFHGCTLQPNSGAHGEFTGLMIIRSWHKSRGDTHRRVCLVPDSAHGTNPASAIMAGMDVVVVNSASNGDIDMDDLRAKADQHADNLAAMMVTYPSTHGVFEREIREAIAIVHDRGGQVYMDGANMNAQVGITSPGTIGADVCHLNLHKTFAIPHGGGGPGIGPVLTAEHLTPFLPGTLDDPGPTGLVVAAPLGSVGVLAISYAYIAMMGSDGLRSATEHAILNANYVATRLKPFINIAFTGPGGRVAHECILDFRAVEKETGVTVEDIAKRLADYGFHAPTMSWPVHGSLMVEPTESENKGELDRFCDAMISIVGEIDQIRRGEIALDDSPLHYAPHTLRDITGGWNRKYSREVGAYPAAWCHANKFWPSVGRVDNVYGDRNLVCSCAPLEAYRTEQAAAGG